MVWLAGQVSFALHQGLDPGDFRRRLRLALDALSPDALVAGWGGPADRWRSCAAEADRSGIPLYVWHPVLAELGPEHDLLGPVGLDGRAAGGWAGRNPGEDFAFVCPNHPDARAVVLERLSAVLREVPAPGVFLDKIRYPSPAAGLAASLGCFCPRCEAAARDIGLDLAAARSRLARVLAGPASEDGLAALGVGSHEQPGEPPLAEWGRFRSEAIAKVVGDAAGLARSDGRLVGLDLFAPFLSRLVGQDYRSLAPLASWVKPMLYCRTVGPAGLPLELHGLLRGLGPDWHAAVEASLGRRIPVGEALLTDGLPVEVAVAEARAAGLLAGPVPAMAGIEVVDRPGLCRTDPETAARFVRALRAAGAAGIVASWDVVGAPPANLEAVAREART